MGLAHALPAQGAQASPVPHHVNSYHRHKAKPHRQVQRVQRDDAKTLKDQMPPCQKNVGPSLKRHALRTSSTVSHGSCHRGERSWCLSPCPTKRLSDRFFMIDRRREGDEPCEEFKVLGSTGNVRLNAEFVTEPSHFSLLPGVHRFHWQVPLV